jgi:V8-like Glu-specific endopeptidase
MVAPIEFQAWEARIERLEAEPLAERVQLRVGSFDRADGVDYRLEDRVRWLDLIADVDQPGRHFFPPKIEAADLRHLFERPAEEVDLPAFRPRHLALHPQPDSLPGELHRRRYARRLYGDKSDGGDPTTVYPLDTRSEFSDTAYPWSCCGRVDTPGGAGSGVMVGRRHMLTASHVIDWGPNNTAGWVKFTPLVFDTSEPFGFAYATRIYWWLQADPSDLIQSQEAAFDYVVCVLDRPLGDLTGWMGSRAYSTDWDGGEFWGHVGYPSDSGGDRPVYHGPGVMDSTVTESAGGRDSFRIMHRNDIIRGQSGGPFFGWWDGEVGPHVIASQSAENWDTTPGPNAAGGGNPLPELVRHALTVEP